MIPIIDIRNATVYRGPTRVFDNLTLSIPEGEHTAILGPNGAGKTTFLKLLTREVYPVQKDGAHVRLFGLERWNVWDLRARLGLVSHELHHAYPDHVRGRDVILSGFYTSIGVWPHQVYTPEQVARTDALMEMFGIRDLADTPFGQMSAGQQRRLLLARALVHDPDVLVLDEPTNGLDLKARFQYIGLVRRLIAQGKTLILVTHRIEEIPPEVERVILLKQGRVLADGPKADVLTSAHLSDLFEIEVSVVQWNGFYQVVPGEPPETGRRDLHNATSIR